MFGILRLLFRSTLTLTCAHWLYAEAILLAPAMEEPLSKTLEEIQIPTHDTWSNDFKENPLAYIQRRLPKTDL